MTSVAERLHRRSNEGRWMDRVRKTATRITALDVTDNKANKVSRGRTTKLVTSFKVCCACSGRLVKRHCWFGNSTEDAVWLKDSLACNKQSKHKFLSNCSINEVDVRVHCREFHNLEIPTPIASLYEHFHSS